LVQSRDLPLSFLLGLRVIAMKALRYAAFVPALLALAPTAGAQDDYCDERPQGGVWVVAGCPDGQTIMADSVWSDWSSIGLVSYGVGGFVMSIIYYAGRGWCLWLHTR
jgi:hypothetical protein